MAVRRPVSVDPGGLLAETFVWTDAAGQAVPVGAGLRAVVTFYVDPSRPLLVASSADVAGGVTVQPGGLVGALAVQIGGDRTARLDFGCMYELAVFSVADPVASLTTLFYGPVRMRRHAALRLDAAAL